MQTNKLSSGFQAAIVLLVPLFVAAQLAWGLSSNDELDIEIDFDSLTSEIIDGMRINTYRGNVKVVRGNHEITGDEAIATISTIDNKFQRLVVNGNPARFHQRSDDESGSIRGNSKTINYIISGESVVEFIGPAHIDLEGSSMDCDENVIYRLETGALDTGPCRQTISN